MKLLIVLFAFQSTILVCQIAKVSGQRSIFDRDGQSYGATRYRRPKKAQRPLPQQKYYATSNLINPDDVRPNSFYNRMPENENSPPDGVNSKRIKIDPTESGKTFHNHPHHHHLHHLHGLHHGHHGLFGHHHPSRRRRPSYAAQNNPCYYRRARAAGSPQGRFFWDLNLYNVVPGTQQQYSDDDCGSYSSASSNYYGDTSGSYSSQYGAGLLNNYLLTLAGYGPRPPKRPYNQPLPTAGLVPNALPGITNTVAGISPTDSINSINSGSGSVNQNPDIYDPVFDDRPVYENQYASQQQQVNTGPNLTPGQIVGGIAQTVNGVIQTLSGNSQQGQFLRTLYNRRRRYRN